MSVETATYISDLNATLPAASDPKAEGDDHIRLLKSTVKTTFPNVTGAVTTTHTQLNYVSGVTSAIQTQINAKAPTASPTFTGTVTIPAGASISGYAPLASPALTGTPTAPTASPGTSTNQLATCQFVVSQAFSTALPSQTGNSGKFLTTDGSAASWGNAVSSVGMSVPSFLSVSGSPITSSGTLAVTYSGTALPVLYGGTGVTTSTGSGANVLNTGPALSGVIINDGYTEETVTANTGTAYTINLVNGTLQVLTLTGNCVYTFPTPSAGQSFTLVQKQDATGSRTVTWPASVKWPAGVAPTLTATASKTDKFVFTAIDASSWLGSVAGQNYTA